MKFNFLKGYFTILNFEERQIRCIFRKEVFVERHPERSEGSRAFVTGFFAIKMAQNDVCGGLRVECII